MKEIWYQGLLKKETLFIAAMATRKVLRKDEQLLTKLQSILKLYKNFHAAADEDKLVILEALEDIREILSRSYITEPLKRNDVTEIEEVLNDLKKHVKAMALDELFSDLNEIKMRMDLVETRFDLKDTIKHSKIYFSDEGEWGTTKVRFDMPGLSASVPAGSDVGNENQDSEETSDGRKKRVKSTEQLLQDRIDSLQRLLKERKTRLVSARRGTKISSALVNSADYTIQQSKRELQRVRDASCRNLSTTTTAGVKSDETGQKQPKSPKA